jgi:hypothetical protein
MDRQRRLPHASEYAVHVAIVRALVLGLDPAARLFHPPNEGRRTPIEGARLRQMGLLPGLPDLGICWPVGKMGWLEVKSDSGRLSDAQRQCHADLQALGFPVAVVRSVDEALDCLRDWGAPLRARPWFLRRPESNQELS